MNGEEVEGLLRRLLEKEQPCISICVQFSAQAVCTVYTILQERWYWRREQFKDVSSFFSEQKPKAP